MSNVNTITLTGNTGAELNELQTKDGTPFGALTLYTQASYKDDTDTWQQCQSVMHRIIVFRPSVMAKLKSFKTGARLTITGELQYRPFDTVTEDGDIVTKYEAAIVARDVEQAALYRKHNSVDMQQEMGI